MKFFFTKIILMNNGLLKQIEELMKTNESQGHILGIYSLFSYGIMKPKCL